MVSSQNFNTNHAQVTLAMITSAGRSSWPSDVPIHDLGTAGLRVPSVVRMKLFTLDRDLVLRRIGTLGLEDRRQMSASFTPWFL